MHKKLILCVILTLILVGMSVGYVALEPARQASAAKRQLDEAVTRGSKNYAALCMSCHGPKGEGVVGIPLNRAVFREGGSEELRSAALLLHETVRDGRSGTTVPSFLKAADGGSISRTAMPAWGQAKGGPLTEQQIEEVVAFIQYGNWESVQGLATLPKMEGEPPTGSSLSAIEQEKGFALFKAKGCVGCHTLGNMGGSVGPDLTHVGSWRDAEYLQNWIKAPEKMDRSSYIWSSGQKVSMGKAAMPAMPTTQAELKTLVNYLSSLK